MLQFAAPKSARFPLTASICWTLPVIGDFRKSISIPASMAAKQSK